MALSQPTVSEIRTAKSQAVGGGRKRCRRGKNCSAACIQAGMTCLVEMPESAGVSLGKVSNFLQQRAPSVPSDLKREIAALGAMAPRQLERSPGAVTRTPQGVRKELADNKLAAWGDDQLRNQLSAAKKLGRDDKIKEIQAELDRRSNDRWNKPVNDVLDIKAKTVDKSIEEAPNSASLKNRINRYLHDPSSSSWNSNKSIYQLHQELEDNLLWLNGKGGEYLSKGELKKEIEKGEKLKKEADEFFRKKSKFEVEQSASGGTRWERGNAKDFDKDLTEGSLKRVGDKTYFGWNQSYGSGSKAIGEGSYGSVIRNPDGTFVKRGAISETEGDIINILGKKGIGPKLVAADINGKHEWHQEDFVNIRKGRIAMSGVPGAPMGDVNSFAKIGGKQVPDIYWKAMGDLHRLGIAHNDAHIDNILVDNKGKGRWVDLGLAQKSPKAALAEAIGSFSGGSGMKEGNWQTRRWNATGIKDWEGHQRSGGTAKEFEEEFPVLGKIVGNRGRMFNQMRDYGLTSGDYAKMSQTPIRSKLEVYEEGPWSKLTNEQAQNLINILYDGI